MSTPLDDLRAAVGRPLPARFDTVERRHVEDFRSAVDEVDPGSADAPVPPTFLACFLDEPPTLPEAWCYGTAWLNGGDRFEVLGPVHVGDTVRSTARLADVVEKHGRSGAMAVLTFVTEFDREDGTPVLRHTGTRIRR